MAELWKVSTEHGLSLSAEEFVGVLSAHHDRIVEEWQALTPEQWEQTSRNPGWSVHDTVRHVADAMQLGASQVVGEPAPFTIGDFDPRTTPDTWLAESAGHPPALTIERFAEAAQRLRERVGERMTAGDSSLGATVYGPAHWTTNVVHIFWDSWLHERDVMIPLGLPVDSTIDEQRLAALYGLVMAMVPARMTGQRFDATIDLTGSGGHVVTAVHESGVISTAESSAGYAPLAADLCSIVDSLSGRGTALVDLVPDAPPMLGDLARFMAS